MLIFTFVKLRAVITDVDGTLYDQWPVQRFVLARLLAFASCHPVRGWKTIQALRAYRQAQESLRWLPSQDQISLQQASSAAERTGHDVRFIRACVAWWMETLPLPAVRQALRPGLKSFCEWALAADLRLAAVSDYDPRAKLRALDVERYFPVVVYAQEPEVGVFKPNPLGLRIAMRRLGVEPDEAIYIGDRPEVDAAAAAAAGMRTIVLASKSGRRTPGITFVKGWPEVQELLASATVPPANACEPVLQSIGRAL